MKCHNIAVYLIIPLALFSIVSLFDNVQAQTNSTSSANQTASQQQQQQNQNANLTAQALMKTDIVALKNTLMNAQLALVDGNIKQALKDVMDLETQLILLEPAPPTKFINNIHKAIAAISTSEIDKSLNTLTNIQVSILKAENLIFKAAVANPQVMQQIHTVNYIVPTPQPQEIQQVDTSKNVVPTPQSEQIQQVDTLETNTIADDFTNIEDS
jgi:acetate kinase